jgi:dolichyl-phosphate beta-glucosyltransferase
MELLSLPGRFFWPLWAWIEATPVHILLVLLLLLLAFALLSVSQLSFTFDREANCSKLFALLHLFAPKPRPVLPSEKTYITSTPSGETSSPRPLPCWYDRWLAERQVAEETIRPLEAFPTPDAGAIEPAELHLSVVFPAYNEEDRVLPTLEEAVAWLDEHIGRPDSGKPASRPSSKRQSRSRSRGDKPMQEVTGYEIIVVNDGSKDKTVDVVLNFAKENGLHDVLRVVNLERNRGKGGGVTHGLRHVRGEYALFADADGASKFSDVRKLIDGCEEVVDGSFRGVAIGSRAHLVGSEAVVKVCPSLPIHPHHQSK